jgi:nucleotide-binding universal stress UspA family protein
VKGENKMEKTILVPLDGTAEGEAILPKLESLVLKYVPSDKSEVVLLKVISIVNFDVLTHDKRAQLPYTEADQKQLNDEASAYLETTAATLRDKGFSVKTMVRTGTVAEEIVNAAREVKANLIAMSTHTRSGIIKWAIGSVADRVVKLEGKIPVLAVQANEKDQSSTIPMSSLHSMVKHS